MNFNRWFFNAGDRVRARWKSMLFAVVLVLWVLLLSALTRPIQMRMPESVFPPNFIACISAILATWICLLFERKPFSWIGIELDRVFVRTWLLGLMLGAFLLGTVAAGVWLCGGFHLLPAPTFSPVILIQSLWLFLLGALFEELTFRGYAFQRGIDAMGLSICQVAFAGVFVLSHLGSPALRLGNPFLPLLTIFLAAVLLGYLYWNTRSLALPLGVHMGWNWLQETLGFSVSGRDFAGVWKPVLEHAPDWITGGAFGLEGSIFSSAVLLFAISVVLGWHRKTSSMLRQLAALGKVKATAPLGALKQAQERDKPKEAS